MGPTDHDIPLRVALAWRELRRGATDVELRAHMFGPDGPYLEQAQVDALEIVGSEPDGWRMTDFADALHVDPSSATRAVDRLESLGLAERSRAHDDKRVVVVRATPEGRRMMRRIQRSRAVGMERLLETFDPDERARFAEYLERFVGSIDRLVDELRRGAEPSSRPATPTR